jgi:fructose/tagatose bisphosphate aldolase
MPLEPAVELLATARRHGYALGYFESWDLASLEGVIDAAEKTRSPAIIGFNGEFLSRRNRELPARLEWYAALGRAAAESAKVPCSLMFNECPADDWVERAIGLGFNLVMLADADANDEELGRRTAALAAIAHRRNVAVEAEIGTLPFGPGGDDGASLTDPALAAAFVRETGVDLLAVSTGNVHVLLDGRQRLDLAHLAAIREKVDVPLVLHGGSGIAAESLCAAIALGVAKVNFGTYLKQRCIAALRNALAEMPENGNPHDTFGGGGGSDLGIVVRRAMCDAVLERIELLGCCGKA